MDTTVTVLCNKALPQIRFFVFNTQGPSISLKGQTEKLMVDIENIEGIEIADVIADDDRISVRANENARWERIEEDLAKVFINNLGATPRFLHVNS